MEGILNYFSLDEHKVNLPGPYSIQMPFKEKTKAEIVQIFCNKGFGIRPLMIESTSCYEGSEKPCGKCRSCLRKFVALTCNGYNDINRLFENDPAEYLQEFLEESIKKNRKSEIKDIRECLNQL
jgi:7-cyano-7-deazaguanine synthase in queuosine biosynthesis